MGVAEEPQAIEISYCKIFPPIGIARLGDSQAEDGWFIGPEDPAARPHDEEGFSFRDGSGAIKRQGARFRIIAFAKDGTPVKELTAGDAEITWSVRLANKKAAWFQFRGTRLARTAFRGEDSSELRPRNPSVGKLALDPRTRQYAPDAERARLLEITASGSVEATRGAPAAAKLSGLFKAAVPVALGELRTDGDGRLVVLGGHGVSDAVDDTGASIRAARWIRNYANNDDWYDDTSDGPVTATVNLAGKDLAVEGAWVLVAPPDFAPDVENLVTLYDVMEEVALQNPALVRPGSTPPLRDPARGVAFDRDIAPILGRMHGYRWVNATGLRGHGFQKPGDFQVVGSAGVLAPELSDPQSTSGRLTRERILRVLRRPSYQRGPKDRDRYDDPAIIAQATGLFMPPLAGDEGDPVPGDPRTWLTLTYAQYARMEAWAQGRFTAASPAPVQGDASKLIEALTLAALEACAGGAFYPGIEMTSIAREPSIYAEAFRIDHKVMGPGDITRFMALPWQADFWECRDHWWPGQRPDDVVTDHEFELLLSQFTEETSGAYQQQFERVLFNRIRWDRGIGPRSRPTLDYQLSRLLPDPGTSSLDAYVRQIASGGGDTFGNLLLGLTPIATYFDYADGTWPKDQPADRLPSPWRLQYVTQEALDAFSGRYFHLRVPSPEEVGIADDPKLPVAELRREWGVRCFSEPARMAAILGNYALAIQGALVAQITAILTEVPLAERTASALKAALQAGVDALEGANPQELTAQDAAFKSLRACEMTEQALDRLYLVATNWSGDMDMVDAWRDLGFVVDRRAVVRGDGDRVEVRARVETGRPKYDGATFRDWFYYLMNIEKHQDFIGFAKRIAERILADAQRLIDQTGLYDRQHPESAIEYSKQSFAAKLDEIYEIMRQQAATSLGWRTGRTRDETIRRIVDLAPFNQTDGAWLRYIANAGPTEAVRSLLFEVWSDEVGNGDPGLHHGTLYTILLSSLGVTLPPVSTRAYADNPDIDESGYVSAVFQLAISLHSEAFFPELLGMTLFLEWEVLSLVPNVKGREFLGIDAHFWRMHVGIDNASNGHGFKARKAVEMYLDHVLKEGGEAAMQGEWQRIWRGFVAFASVGYNLWANQDGQDDLTISRRHPGTPEDRVADLMARKARYGSLNHLDNRLGGHRINDLFERPDIFVRELASSPWVVAGKPDDSRLLTYLTTFEGPMFKVFDDRDLALFRDWILWLGREGDTPIPKRFITKGESMMILLAELRELAQGSDGHRRYRLATPGKAAATIAALFERGDLKALMRALADPTNGWVVPFDPGASPLVVDQARGTRPMGVALDRRFDSLAGQLGREVVIRWIEAGCPIPGEAAPAKDDVPRQPAWNGEVLFVQTHGQGAVH